MPEITLYFPKDTIPLYKKIIEKSKEMGIRPSTLCKVLIALMLEKGENDD